MAPSERTPGHPDTPEKPQRLSIPTNAETGSRGDVKPFPWLVCQGGAGAKGCSNRFQTQDANKNPVILVHQLLPKSVFRPCHRATPYNTYIVLPISPNLKIFKDHDMFSLHFAPFSVRKFSRLTTLQSPRSLSSHWRHLLGCQQFLRSPSWYSLSRPPRCWTYRPWQLKVR